MSIDFQMVNKDMVLSGNGQFEIVEGKDKLSQDLQKIFLTDLGENKFNFYYGTNLRSLVGLTAAEPLGDSLMASQVGETVDYYRRLQGLQKLDQDVTDEELINKIDSLQIQKLEKGKVNLVFDVITESGLPVVINMRI
jgi:phage baseplate assembly protein W